MSREMKIIAIVVGAIVVLGLAGAGVAMAADPPKPPVNVHATFMGKVAKILGIDQQKLQDAYTQAGSEMLDDAVAAGKMTKEQADRMKEWTKQAGKDGMPPMMGPSWGPGFGPMDRMHRGFWGRGPKGPAGQERPGGEKGPRVLPWQRTPTPTQ
jgi:hypothetical protein